MISLSLFVGVMDDVISCCMTGESTTLRFLLKDRVGRRADWKKSVIFFCSDMS
jgi:hypothetical protein